ncbi:MAG: sigma-70 family RNA polymerase sigma factor [Planctomycetota bacterium]
MTTFHVDPRSLLADLDFVRGIARQLLADPADAEDIAQGTVVRALQPGGSRTKAWLSTVGRNLARNRKRDEARRARHEWVAARSRASDQVAAPSAEEIVAREEMRRQVVDCVLALEQPFRDVVVLRFFEGLEPVEIAERLQVPRSTVRTRLKRGLDRVKEKLDVRSDGDRSRWLAGIAPLAVGLPSGAAVGAPLAVFALNKFLLVAAGVLLTVLATLALDPFSGGEPKPLLNDSVPIAMGENDESGNAPGVDEVLIRRSSRTDEGGEPKPPVEAWNPMRFPADRAVHALAGRAIDGERNGIAGATVSLRPRTGTLPRTMAILDDRARPEAVLTDASGHFSFDSVPDGPWSIHVESRPSDAESLVGERRLVLTEDRSGVTVPLEKPREKLPLQVRVLDGNGVVVSGSEVTVTSYSSTVGRSAKRLSVVQQTDENGLAQFAAESNQRGSFVYARLEDGRVGFSHVWATGVEIRVILGTASSLSGRLLGVDPSQLEGIEVFAALNPTTDNPFAQGRGPSFEARVEGGRYVIDELPAGQIEVFVRSPLGVRQVTELVSRVANTSALKTLRFQPGENKIEDLHLQIGARLEGVVTDDLGQPVVGARVRTVAVPKTSNYPEGFVLRGVHVWRLDSDPNDSWRPRLAERLTVTDHEGRYSFVGLFPGSHRVEVETDSLSFDRREGVALTPHQPTFLEHRLTRAGVLQAKVGEGSYFGVIPFGSSEPMMIAIIRDHVFTFPGMVPGDYQIARFHSDSSVAPVVLGTATVEAGRTTFVDVSQQVAACVFHGAVIDGEGPVAGAAVRINGAWVRAGPDGRFELGRSAPLSNNFGRSNFFVALDGAQWTVPVPDEAYNVDYWSGVVRLGDHRLEIEATDLDGQPLPATLTWTGRPDQLEGSVLAFEASVATAADGRLVMSRMPRGQLQVEARFENGATVETTVSVPSSRPLVLRRPLTGSVEVQVLDAQGQPMGRATVRLWHWNGEGPAPSDPYSIRVRSNGYQSVQTDADGWARFEAAEVGAVVVGRPAGFGTLSREFPAQRIEVRSGEVSRAELRRTP